jgi:protein translocase SecG subunit
MNALHIAQIAASVVLVVLILIQERSSGLSGLLGVGSGDASYQTRRGVERVVFWATIAMGIVFAALAVLNLVL